DLLRTLEPFVAFIPVASTTGGGAAGTGASGSAAGWTRVVRLSHLGGPAGRAGDAGRRRAGRAGIPRPVLRRHHRADRGEAAEQALVPRRQLVGRPLPSVERRWGQ